MSSKKEFLTLTEAAQFCEVSYHTFRNWVLKGKIPYITHPISKWRLFRKEEIEKLKEKLKLE